MRRVEAEGRGKRRYSGEKTQTIFETRSWQQHTLRTATVKVRRRKSIFEVYNISKLRGGGGIKRARWGKNHWVTEQYYHHLHLFAPCTSHKYVILTFRTLCMEKIIGQLNTACMKVYK